MDSKEAKAIADIEQYGCHSNPSVQADPPNLNSLISR
jgi:hypothetical protein